MRDLLLHSRFFLRLLTVHACLAASSAALAQMEVQVSQQQNQREASDQAAIPELVWSDARARELETALNRAVEHGLDPTAFVKRSHIPRGRLRDRALTRAAIDYARALATGLVDPRSVRDIYTLARPRFDAARELARVFDSGRDLNEWFESLAPQTVAYRKLSAAYVQERARAAHGTGLAVPAGAVLWRGAVDDRVPAIRDALESLGYSVAEQGLRATTYTAGLEKIVEAFQADHGLKVDGAIGPATLSALNRSPSDRAFVLAVNLERLRRETRVPPSTRVDVNTATAELTFFRRGQIVDRRRVVVGQPGWETPQLSSPIFRLVANPSWTVPKSIEHEELRGKSPAWLASRNMMRKDGWIVQQPGPSNALGQVKLDMRNDYAIYLHDTPAQALFERSDRHASHGCVRVEDAEGFARVIVEQEGKLGEFSRVMASGKESFVDLEDQIPVRLIYHTATIGQDGSVRIHKDIYGWDADLGMAMGLTVSAQRRPVHAHHVDIAP